MNRSLPLSPLQQMLREQTRESHQRVDHHPLLAPLVRPELTTEAYGRALQALHGIQQGMESGLSRFLEETPSLGDYPLSLRLHHLERDLQQMDLQPLPLQRPFPKITSVAEWLATLYVVEGSAMGGAFIAKLLQERRGSELPRHFYSNKREEVTLRWQHFWDYTHQRLTEAEYLPLVIAAKVCFSTIIGHLQQVEESGQ
ncbi:MAG: biliverdin-producing heme oxygenase [Gammaproteobacteria bacterium]|nr:biliverdin-producing heme oxygenase [Gammaproteobacteria bacterium]